MQLARVEGFGDVVIRTQFETDDAIRLLAHGGEDDDGHIGLRAQPAREVEARLARHHQVQHDKVIAPLRPDAAGLPRVAGDGDAHALAFEEFAEKLADLAVIIDDEDVGCCVHGRYNSLEPSGYSPVL